MKKHTGRLVFLFFWLVLSSGVFFGGPQQQGAKPAPIPVPDPEIKASQRVVDDTVTEDPLIKRFVSRYGTPINQKLAKVLAVSNAEIRRGRGGGSMGLVLTDAMRAEANARSKKHVAVAISNTGGVRADLPAGNITTRDVFTVMPFENSLVTVDLKGEHLQKIADYVARSYKESGGFPVSGMKIRFKDGQVLELLIEGKPVDPQGTYTVVTSDYLYSGGDGYNFSAGTNFTRLHVTLRDAIIHYFLAQKNIVIPTEPRFVDESEKKPIEN
ncbi:MAG: 5'-nucleotidase C-terminal domain-containing protein [Blastocatellia bacterium]|nr:5'-nucleotidase C-terminal domain-containing protein [Blastocatellia bacterium]